MSIRKKLLAVAVLPLFATAILAAATFSAQSVRAQAAATADNAFAQRMALTDAAIAVGTERLEVARGLDSSEAQALVDLLLSDASRFPQEIQSSFSRAATFVQAARNGLPKDATDSYNAATGDLLAAADAIKITFPSVGASVNGEAVEDIARLIDTTDRAWIDFGELGDGALNPRDITEAATLFTLAADARQLVRNDGTGDTAEVVLATIRVTDAMSDYQESAVDSLFSSNQRVITAVEGYSAASGYRDRWVPAYERSSVNLAFEISNNRDEARRYQLLAAVGGAVGLLLLGFFAVIIKRSISNPLQELLDGTDILVGETMPEMIEKMRTVEVGEDLEPPELLAKQTEDEIGDLVSSFNDLGRTAHRLAVEHAMLRHNTFSTLFDFGERQAHLVDRLLQGLNGLVIDERNIAMLARLGELDHLASTVRRNAQSMVVLGGDYTERPWSAPTPIERIVRSAVAHVEAYDRVNHARLNPGFVRGSAASDLQHILAELVENGLHNSDSKSRVVLDGFWSDERYVLVVSDSGIGMSAAEISVNSGRLREMPRFDQEPATKLGLAVVGRLARRHGIEVVITAKDVGINVVVTLPAVIVSRTEEVEVPASLAGAPSPRTQRFDAQIPAMTADSVPPGALSANSPYDMSDDPFDDRSAFNEPVQVAQGGSPAAFQTSESDAGPRISTDAAADGFYETLSTPAPDEPPSSLRGSVSPEIASAIEALRGTGD